MKRLFSKFPLLGKIKSHCSPKGERVKINLGGKIYIGFTLLVGFAAVNTGNNILYILLSFLLALMGISGLLSRYNLKGLKVSVIPPEEVWCCKETPFGIRLLNRKRFPAFLVEVLEGKLGLKKLFPMVEKTEEGQAVLNFPKRGIYRPTSVVVKSTFPFGLFERSFSIPPPKEEILVFPKPLEFPFSLPPSPPLREQKGEQFLKFVTETGAAVEGVKEYAGEGFRRIHWKAFARLGELYAKEVSDEELLRRVIIDLERIEGKDLEEKISKATYAILKLKKLGYAVGLKYGDREIPPAAGNEHFKELLKFLALL